MSDDCCDSCKFSELKGEVCVCVGGLGGGDQNTLINTEKQVKMFLKQLLELRSHPKFNLH